MKKLLLKIKLFFVTIFGNLDKFLQENVDEAISVVNAIKGVVSNGMVGMVVKITPTDVDDKALKSVNAYLDIAIQKLAIAKECNGLDTQEKRLTCYLEQIKKLSPDMQAAVYLKTASLYAQAKATIGGVKAVKKAEISDIDTLVQLRYKDIKL